MLAGQWTGKQGRLLSIERGSVGGPQGVDVCPSGKSVGSVHADTSGSGAECRVWIRREEGKEAGGGFLAASSGTWGAGNDPWFCLKTPEPWLILAHLCRYKDYREPPWSEHKYDISKDFWAVLAARLAFVIVFQVRQALVSGRLEKRAWRKPSEPRTGSQGRRWPVSGALGDLEAWQPWALCRDRS